MGDAIGGVGSPALTDEMLGDLVAATRALIAAPPSDPFETVVARVIVDAARTVKADRAAMWLQRGDAIEVVATTGMRATTVDRFQHVDVAPDTPGEHILRRRGPVTWSTHAQARRYFPVVSISDLGSGYVAPLHMGGRFSGVLFVGWSQQHRTIQRSERMFLEGVAHCCALAVERSTREERPDVGDDEIVAIGDAFSVRLTTSGEQSIVSIAGEVDFGNENELEHALQSVMREHARVKLVFDLADVAFLSVAAARIVVAACRQRSGDTALPILNASPTARRVLDWLDDGRANREEGDAGR